MDQQPSQEKIQVPRTDQPAPVGSSSQDQPPAYASLQPTLPAEPIQPTNVVFVVGQPQVGPDPMTMICPHCRASVTSVIDPEPSLKTHLAFLLCCLIGCWCCAPLVYCTDGCLSKKHSCPECNVFLGVYEG